MFVEVYDDDAPAVVWLFAGTANDDGDHARWLACMRRVDAVAGARGGAALLVIDEGNPPPPQAERDGVIGVARAITGSTPLAVVTSSPIVRGVLGGVSAFAAVRFPLKGFATAEAASAWLAARSRVSSAHLTAMLDEARARAVSRARPR